jgi:hypothetical protein
MLQLEEAFHPSRIHIVRNGRATHGYRLAEYGLQGGVQTVQLCPFEVLRHPAGPDAGAEETFVGINVSYSVEQFLVQQGSFDGGAAGTEEAGEVFFGDLQGFLARAGEARSFFCRRTVQLHAPEAPGVDKAEFPPGSQMEDAMSVGRDGCIGIRNEQAAGHTQVHDPLQAGSLAMLKIEDDVFAYAMDACNTPAG